MAKTIARQILSFLLKILFVIVLVIIAFIIGTMVGYSVLGHGHPTDVFKPEVWQSIFNYFVKPTIIK